MEDISIMDDQPSLYSLQNGFMYPLSYRTTCRAIYITAVTRVTKKKKCEFIFPT